MEPAIRSLRALDAEDAATVHARAFPDAFLTSLGPDVVAALYRDAASLPGAFAIGARRDDELVGVVIGVAGADAFFSRFYRRHAPRVAATVLRAVVRDPGARRHVRRRAGHLRYAAEGVLRRRATAASEPVPARLLSIAVDERARGSGVAGALVDALCERLADARIDRVGLSVQRENAPAIAFYERSGWRRERETEDAVWYWRPTRVRDRAR